MNGGSPAARYLRRHSGIAVRRRHTDPLQATDLGIDCAGERLIVWHRDELIAAGRVTSDADER